MEHNLGNAQKILFTNYAKYNVVSQIPTIYVCVEELPVFDFLCYMYM